MMHDLSFIIPHCIVVILVTWLYLYLLYASVCAVRDSYRERDYSCMAFITCLTVFWIDVPFIWLFS